MADLPPGMLRNGRPRDPIFEEDEYLFRRVSPEVWAFKDGAHVNAKAQFDPVMHLRWKDKLRWKIRTFLRPHQAIAIRQEPPAH
jgi:hypothetical protein